MRRTPCLLLVLISAALVAANLNISEPAAITASVLDDLNFEKLPGDPKLLGSPPKYTVTKKTLDFLKKYEGKSIEIASDGSLAIEEK